MAWGRDDQPSRFIPSAMAPLLTMMGGYFLLFLMLWLVRIRTMILERRAQSLMVGVEA